MTSPSTTGPEPVSLDPPAPTEARTSEPEHSPSGAHLLPAGVAASPGPVRHGALDAALAAARSGDPAAWRTLYEELQPPLLGYLRARGASEPEDLVGEVFLQIVRDLQRFRGTFTQFKAWVFTIGYRRSVDDARARARKPPGMLLDPDARPPAALTGDVERDAVRRLTETEIRRVLCSLSREQESVLLLRIFGALTVDDVASILGKRPGAVKALQRRALEALRRQNVPF